MKDSSGAAGLTLTCVEHTRWSASDWLLGPFAYWSTSGAPAQCIYKSADEGPLRQIKDPDEVDSTVEQLLNASDFNCVNFLAMAFDVNANLGVAQRALNNTASGTSAITAFVSAAATAGLSLGNLVFFNFFDAYSQEYFAGQTAPYVASAIWADRDNKRKDILKKENRCSDNMIKEKGSCPDQDIKDKAAHGSERPSYTINDGINDVQAYDRTCSFEAGLQILAKQGITPSPRPSPGGPSSTGAAGDSSGGAAGANPGGRTNPSGAASPVGAASPTAAPSP